MNLLLRGEVEHEADQCQSGGEDLFLGAPGAVVALPGERFMTNVLNVWIFVIISI